MLFRSVVLEQIAEIGNVVAVNAILAKLADSSRYWIEMPVDVAALRFIDMPGGHAAATVRCLPGPLLAAERIGTVERLAPDLDALGRMARLIAIVDDPLDLNKPESSRAPLRINAFLQMTIDGVEMRDAVYIPRAAVREGNRVWLMTPDRRLAIKDVEIIYSETDGVFVRGLNAGETLVVSTLISPVEGMALRTAEMSNAPDSSAPNGGGR